MHRPLSLWNRLSLFVTECSNYFTFFRRTAKHLKEIVFYSAQAQYIAFFEGLINALIKEHSAKLCYITSDPHDPILKQSSPDITTFYFNKLFPFVMPFIDARVIVMTMPDLNQFHIRRSINNPNHVYVFHSLMSAHVIYRLGAFNHYDTIFCVGPYHIKEIRQTEEVYGLEPKLLLEVGYYRAEKIFTDHKSYLRDSAKETKARNCILIAPGWQVSNIIETCGSELITTLLDGGYDVILRPHPMTIAKKPEQLRALTRDFGSHKNFHMDTESASEKTLHKADVLISDWSGVALEYAFGTERPVLFIDLPKKVHNPEYEKLGIEAVEVRIRDQIGKVIRVEDIPEANLIIKDFLKKREAFRDKIRRVREKCLYNFGDSSEISADYIMDIYHGRL